MRHRYLLFIVVFINLFSITTSQAQVSVGGGALIIDTSISTQTLPKIRVAQNGWIFAGFVTNNDYRIFRSENGGSTWTKIVDNGLVLSDWDLEVTGNTDATTKLWMAAVYKGDSMSVYAFDGSTGSPLHKLAYTPPVGATCSNVAIATDFKNPGVAANPYSMAVAVSVNGGSIDSLLFFQSNDSGATWSYNNVYTTINYLHRLSMAYGYSPTYDSGVFFLAGEYNFAKSASNNNQDIFYLSEQEGVSGFKGIYYASSVDKDWAANISHPCVIVENSSFFENDSLDLSAIILFNTNSGVSAMTTMTAMKDTPAYNRWRVNNVLSVYYNNAVPTTANGVFNTANETFVFTVGDTVNKLLNYYELSYDSISNTKDTDNYVPFKLIYTDSVYNFAYGDPHCDFDPATSMPVADWIGDFDSATFTFFDAKDTSLYVDTGTAVSSQPVLPQFKLFPNPADQYLNIVLTQALSENTQVSIYNLLGQEVFTLPKTKGTSIRLNVSRLTTGSYYIRLLNGAGEQIEKLTVIH